MRSRAMQVTLATTARPKVDELRLISLFGERMTAMPSAVALGSLAYQTVVLGTTLSLWFALIVKYSASRLSAFTFLTPLFGVAAGHFLLGEPLTPAFAVAVALVALGLILVNRPR